MIDDTTLTPQAPDAPEIANDVQPEQTESSESIQQAQQPRETPQEMNFRNLREKAERIQRERDEALVRLKQYEESQKVESDTLKPDDLAEGKHINNVHSRIKDLERQVMETKLRSQYPDIDKVVNDTTLAIIKEKYPHLARTIGSSKDFYDQAISAYTIIREMGIYQDPAPYESDRAAALKNAYKPKPTASISPQQGDSPMSKANAFANGLTDELRKQLYKEMIDAKNSF